MSRVGLGFRLFPSERDDYGTTVTALMPDGTTTARHFQGSGATRAVAEWCDETGAKVVCLSTPETIFRDLQGTRETLADSVVKPGSGVIAARITGLQLPESTMLGRIGRLDLLAHSIPLTGEPTHDPSNG